jgi:hypothetical protein
LQKLILNVVYLLLVGGNLTALSGLDGKNQWTNIVQTSAAANDVSYGSHGQVFETRKEILLNMDENLGMMGVRYKNWKYLNGNNKSCYQIMKPMR